MDETAFSTKRHTTIKSPPLRRTAKVDKTGVELTEPAILLTGDSFPVVGIGASAGGLEALEEFFSVVPVDSGMAFVVVQHLDPTHTGMLPGLLQRSTRMVVAQVKDGTRVLPNGVYVIPPNRDLSISHGVLHLHELTSPRGLRLPIDFFFCALAEARQKHSVGVILSGMGSDGTEGLQAIKANGGIVAIQEPATAKFDSMPRSAIEAGLADVVGAAAELPRMIIAILQDTPNIAESEVSHAGNEGATEAIITHLHKRTGSDFSTYKRNMLQRRMERRMGIHQLAVMDDYVQYVQDNPGELDLLFKELLIGVTEFFRDPAAWDQLRSEGLSALLLNRAPGHAFRAWVPGCSTGEEAYSLAMSLSEALADINPLANFPIQIFATDINPDAIASARQGLYPAKCVTGIAQNRLSRFFISESSGFRICKEISQMVTFATQNVLMDPPFTKLDTICCRNLMIYLTASVQRKLIPMFHYSLNSGGLLFIGSAETAGEDAGLFSPLGGKSRIYRRNETGSHSKPVSMPAPFSAVPIVGPYLAPAAKPSASLQTMAEQLILQHYAPPALLTSQEGDIFYISGRTGKYLEPPAGKANWNLFAMAREGLNYELTGAFQIATHSTETVVLRHLKVEVNGTLHWLDVAIRRLDGPGPLFGMVLVVFTDLPAPVATPVLSRTKKLSIGASQLASLEQELLRIRKEARSTLEAMQTVQEELRATNEEYQSTNEELQSTNEELTTSKEEMQSMNEELQTVNAELRTKVEELSKTGDDLKNLLDSTHIATLFLDRNLNIRRFTPSMTGIIKFQPSDAGRAITDLASQLNYTDLAADAREVLETLMSMDKSVSAHDGRWFNVRIMPYRTLDDRIDGVVLTFADITVAKTLESRLRGRQSSLEKQVAAQAGKTIRPGRKRTKKKAKTIDPLPITP